MKSPKMPKQAHTARTKHGMGDYCGMALKAKIGRVRDSYMVNSNPMTEKKLKTPPKSLA